MIERKFVQEKLKEFHIQEHIDHTFKRVGHSNTKMVRTPLGEKIIISAFKPGLVVGRKGENIKKLTKTLKSRFGLENPQVEIAEIPNPHLDARVVAERIANTMEMFGSTKFKAIGHRTMSDVMGAGALGIEILISGKVPSSRAKRWRFYTGYIKKCGNVAMSGVRTAYATAELKSGTVGIQVRIMPPDVILPDKVELHEPVVEEVKSEELKEEKKPKKRSVRKRPTRKKTTKKIKKAEKSAKERKSEDIKQYADVNDPKRKA
jgi:small subunit ribosomal protein S3